MKSLDKIFAKRKLIDSKGQPCHWKKLLCSSNFSTNQPIFKTKNYSESCFSCDYITETEFLKFKNCHQPFDLKSYFNCENPNLLYIIICNGCNKEYIGWTNWRAVYREIYHLHIQQQPGYEKTEVEIHLQTSEKGKYKIFPK